MTTASRTTASRSADQHRPELPADQLYDQGEVRRMFNRMSASYDRMNLILSFGFSAAWRRQLLALVADHPAPVAVVDLMSGRGETWAEIARRYPRSSITAVDFSERMVTASATRNHAVHENRVSILCEDVLCSSVPDTSVDIVVCAFGLKTLNSEQSRRLADEVARILRPGGRFAFIEITKPAHAMLRFGYLLYLRCLVPLAATLLLADATDYRMLHHYLNDYGNGARARDAFCVQQSLRVQTRRHFFGCATSLSGHRIA